LELIHGDIPDSPLRNRIEKVKICAEFMTSLLNNVLDSAKLNSGGIDVITSKVKLVPFV
jgi:hypothetical protein